MTDARRAEVAAAIAAEEAAAARICAAWAATIAAAGEAAKQAAEEEAAKRAADEESAKRVAEGEAAKQAAKEESAKRAAKGEAAKGATNTAPTPWFILPFSLRTVVAGVAAAVFAAVMATISFTDRAVRDGMYFLAVVVAVLSIGYAAVNFVPAHPVGASALMPCRPLQSSSTIVYQTLEASVLVDAFDVTTGNETDGDVTVCVDTGADMLCLTSTTNTRVLMWSPDIVVRVANSQNNRA